MLLLIHFVLILLLIYSVNMPHNNWETNCAPVDQLIIPLTWSDFIKPCTWTAHVHICGYLDLMMIYRYAKYSPCSRHVAPRLCPPGSPGASVFSAASTLKALCILANSSTPQVHSPHPKRGRQREINRQKGDGIGTCTDKNHLYMNPVMQYDNDIF